MPAQTTFKLRRGAASLWTSTNPVLNPGEPGLETDTNKVKYGDGVTAWNALDYASGGASVEVGVTAPVDPQPNTLWFNSETATMYIRLGSNWVETSPAVVGPQGPAGEAGPQGLQGPSGVISVSSPITNTGTTTEAVLGLNQSALSITKSQVSDFAHTHAQSDITNLSTDLAAKASLTGIETLTNKTIKNPNLNAGAREKFVVSATAFGGTTVSIWAESEGPIKYLTSAATSDSTVSLATGTGTSISDWIGVGNSYTYVLMITNGATAYRPNPQVLLNGVYTDIKWLGGVRPAANANAIDAYTFTVVQPTANSYIVFASQARYI